MIRSKQKRSENEYMMKKDVLTSSFKSSVNSLIRRISKQKDIITSHYGPIVLSTKKDERPIFEISPDLDPTGHKFVKQLNEMQEKVPQTIMVKLRCVRCIKDKISNGHFLLIVHAMDRLGGNRIYFDINKTEKQYKVLSKNLRDFAKKKRTYLNSENREIQTEDADGKISFTAAQATGLGFFKSGKINAVVEDDEDPFGNDLESGEAVEKPIDPENDVHLDFDKTYSRYIRFNGRYQDDNLDFEDTITVLLPANMETTNNLQF